MPAGVRLCEVARDPARGHARRPGGLCRRPEKARRIAGKMRERAAPRLGDEKIRLPEGRQWGPDDPRAAADAYAGAMRGIGRGD